ncbi:hypothetical protein FB45DRAFT_749135 [Roridomyces roridus]|uniref:Clp1 n=1 Tax=Roridomyces roridus TaxID=1738132 RepID=A0AAD7BRG8_9AGAR|nr:hypothetical protein FB45DRAFT_749135 [Roridomyces roridus]
MQDAEPLPPPQPSLTTQTYRLPRELLRPAYQEISRETLQAVDPDLGDVDDIEIEYLRDAFEDIGPALYRTLASVVADPPKESLPKELVISVTDQGDFPAPTHLLAVYGSPSPAASSSSKDVAAETPRQVTLIPVHAVVLTIYCARLPPLIPTPASQERTPTYKVPVQPLCLPSPTTFPLLSSFLYTKRSSHLLKSLLPTPPPPTLTSTEGGPSESRTQHLSAFAATLASTYTAQALLRHIHTTHGLWQNACVLGVHDDGLWEVLELVWEVLLTAMAISAGTPDLMVKRLTPPPPEQEREQEEGEQGDAPDAEQAGSATASESGTPAPT